MAMDLNDGFIDDDELLDDEPQELEDSNSVNSAWLQATEEDLDPQDENYANESEEEEGEDAITLYLRDNGIEDRNRIKFLNDEGEIEERPWDSLTNSEQLLILRSSSRTAEDDLDEAEIGLLNLLRANNITPQLYLNYIYLQGQALAAQLLQNYYNLQLQALQEPSYTSDQLTDEELFILDMQSRVEDITDDELVEALTSAKENEDLFNKLMKGIRAEYQRLEAEKDLRDYLAALQQLLDAFNYYAGTVNQQIANLQNIGDLDINMDSDDMDELLEFILGQDESGNNYFLLALQDPETLVKMAWFALHGEDIFNGISDYYNLQIYQALQDGYMRGLAAKNNSLQQKKSPTVAYKPKLDNQKNIKTFKSLDDLYED